MDTCSKPLDPAVVMIPVLPLVNLQARGSVLLRPAESDESPGAVVHPMARSNPLGRHSGPGAGAGDLVETVEHPPVPVLWDGPAVALFALPGGGAAALENACPRRSISAVAFRAGVSLAARPCEMRHAQSVHGCHISSQMLA